MAKEEIPAVSGARNAVKNAKEVLKKAVKRPAPEPRKTRKKK